LQPHLPDAAAGRRRRDLRPPDCQHFYFISTASHASIGFFIFAASQFLRAATAAISPLFSEASITAFLRELAFSWDAADADSHFLAI